MPKPQPSRRFFIKNLAYLGVATALGISAYELSKPKELTLDALLHVPCVDKVADASNFPLDVIYIPFGHPSSSFTIAGQENRNAFQIEKICTELYDAFGVKSLLLEGLDQNSVEIYNQKNRATIHSGNLSPSAIEDDHIMSVMLSSRKWKLYPGEVKETIDDAYSVGEPARKIDNAYGSYLQQRVMQLNADIANDPNSAKKMIQDAKFDLEYRRQEAQTQVNDLFTPELLSKLYGVAVIKRNQQICEKIIDCKQKGKSPLIVIYGGVHMPGLISSFKSKNLNYAVVYPTNFNPLLGLDLDHPEKSLKATFDIRPAKFNTP